MLCDETCRKHANLLHLERQLELERTKLSDMASQQIHQSRRLSATRAIVAQSRRVDNLLNAIAALQEKPCIE